MQLVQSFEIQIGTIHEVDGAWFRNENIKNIDVMNFPIGDPDECRDVPSQIKKGMKFYSAL